MNWITYGLLMFCSSVALYLTVRKASLQKVSVPLINLAMFAVPLISYSIISLNGNQSFAISLPNAFLLIAAAVLFAYGGNTVSLKAIEVAPNPGYSLVLSKSYVLFTTIVAILLFGAELSLQKTIAILLIVGFSALIMINPRNVKKVENNNWIVLSFGAFFAWGMLSLSSKYLFTHGVGTIPFLVYLYILVTICITVSILKNKTSIKNDIKTHWPILLGIGVFSTLFNLGQFEGIKTAPNIGYINAINASSIAVVTIFSIILFKDELSVKKLIGIFGVIAGLILLLI